MRLSDFDYDLPPELIAQTAVEPRDSSRLFVYDRASDSVTHKTFRDLPGLLRAGDVLVINDTKVLPARLTTTEGREVFLVRRVTKSPLTPLNKGDDERSDPGGFYVSRDSSSATPPQNDKCVWECLVRGAKHFAVGATFTIGEDLSGEVLEILPDGERVIAFTSSDFDAAIEKYGATPLPPYIHSDEKKVDRYQTVYADDTKKNSVAAPTAGLHFTPELFERLAARGVQIEKVTLSVGLGTFQPVKVENIEDHTMHAEFFTLTPAVAERLNKAKSEKRRVIAVGTTSCRVLESAADACGRLIPQTRETDIFIRPGYTFRVLDGLITNFHLPKSTLLMLLAAFIGREKVLALYELAIRERYRFFSFGDAMFIS